MFLLKEQFCFCHSVADDIVPIRILWNDTFHMTLLRFKYTIFIGISRFGSYGNASYMLNNNHIL
jgi:hypothetical protein